MDGWTTGETIGGFRRLALVGRGAQARVWKARCEDASSGIVPKGTVVALKMTAVSLSDAEGHWRRLEPRIAELRRMDHPNVVRYLGCFRERRDGEELQVVVQELLEGETLKERMSRHNAAIDVDAGLDIVKAAARGLAYASERGVFHRDVKPANIFLTADGNVKLIDFGIARQDGETVDGSSNLRGTSDYMAPDFLADESFRGDAQSDVFSLGAVFHEIVTGRKPYLDEAASDITGWMSRWTPWVGNPKDPSKSPIMVDLISERLLTGAADVLEKALTPDRSQRFAGFADLLAALDGIRYIEQRHEGKTYRRLRFIGRGGFGEVFKARWMETRTDVAVKQLLNPSYAMRFHREAKVMRQLESPCFVRFVDFFETAGHAFLVMAFLDGMPGSSLRDAISAQAGADGRPTGLPKGLVLSAFERYARALAVMHARGIVHRDIKPGNLYFPANRPDKVAIMDFGIVRDMDSFTSGTVPCTLDFAPPEIVVSENRGGPAMDVFALGLCLYEALTGKTAYPRLPGGVAGVARLIERAKNKVPPSFDDPRIGDDAELLGLLKRMTEPDAARRLADANEVAVCLRRLFCRKQVDADCPPTVVFDRTTDVTMPIDEARLMDWFRQWQKAHPDWKPDESGLPDISSEQRGKAKPFLFAIAIGVIAGLLIGVGAFVLTRKPVPVQIQAPVQIPAQVQDPVSVAVPVPPLMPEVQIVTNVVNIVEPAPSPHPDEETLKALREKEEEFKRREEEQRKREKEQEEREAEFRRQQEARAVEEAELKRQREEQEAELKRQREAQEAELKRLEAERLKKEAEIKRREDEQRKLAEEQAKRDAELKRKEAERKAKEVKPKTYTDEVRRLVEDARFYAEAGQDDQVVKFFHDALSKGYVLTDADMTLFEESFRRHNDFLKREITRLESEDYRKEQNFRSIKGYRNEQRQLLDWYRDAKGKESR